MKSRPNCKGKCVDGDGDHGLDTIVARRSRQCQTETMHLIDQLAAKIAAWRDAVHCCWRWMGWLATSVRFGTPFARRCPTWYAGPPQLVAWQDIAIVQVVKRRTAKPWILHGVLSRVVKAGDTAAQTLARWWCHQYGLYRAPQRHLPSAAGLLARRTRSLARQATTLTAGMYVVGCFYNFCDEHQSLRLPLWIADQRRHCGFSAPRPWRCTRPTTLDA